MKRGFSIRRCPKCNGNIFFDCDESIGSKEHKHGWYGWCLQCGYTLYLPADEVPAEELKV